LIKLINFHVPFFLYGYVQAKVPYEATLIEVMKISKTKKQGSTTQTDCLFKANRYFSKLFHQEDVALPISSSKTHGIKGRDNNFVWKK
jgi:hypothetical protein